MLRVGIIGYGIRCANMVSTLCKKGDVRIVAIADVDPEGVKQRVERYKFTGMEDYNFYYDAEEMIQKENLDGVVIATRCNLHTDYAVLVAKYNIPMFLEKPVAISDEQVAKLKEIPREMVDKTIVSFPLRMTPLVQKAKEIIDSGKLGKISQVQAWNNVDYARVYYKEWLRDENITQGLFLQKATHDFDYINYLLGDRRPVRVCAMKTKNIFIGDEPEGITCFDCPKNQTCPESYYVINKRVPGNCPKEFFRCSFAKDTGNEDSGSAIVMYDDGLHAVYTQNFVVRNEFAGKRGARVIGYEASLEFDWHTKEIKVLHHQSDIIETYKIASHGSHGGGDDVLCESFVEVMQGKGKSVAPLSEGILSAHMCLKAKKSSIDYTFEEI